MTGETKLHPLRVRPGARFTCHGDGLCCSDVHLLGPVTGDEARVLNAIDERILAWSGDDRVLVTTVDGRCMFAGAGVCELHARLGPEVKPASCKQFPFMLVTTPTGGRVTTEHRCPRQPEARRAPLGTGAARARGDARLRRRPARGARRASFASQPKQSFKFLFLTHV